MALAKTAGEKEQAVLDLLRRFRPDQAQHGTDQEQAPSAEFGTAFTRTTLARLSLSYPEIDESLFHTYLAFLMQTGHLPIPARCNIP